MCIFVSSDYKKAFDVSETVPSVVPSGNNSTTKSCLQRFKYLAAVSRTPSINIGSNSNSPCPYATMVQW